MITLKEIAAEAGVSMMTVSNVINNNYTKVSPETVQKVQRIIEKYHYVPNMAARSLSAKASHIVALLLPQWGESADNLLQDPYGSQMIGMLESRLRERGYYVMLCVFTTVEQVLILQRNWQIDGSILVFPHRDPITRELVRRSTTPLVVIDCYYADMEMLALKIDDYKGGYIATRYLLERGHCRIGFGCPDMTDSSVIRDRYTGYSAAMEEYGLRPDARWLFNDYNHQQGGERIGREIWALEERPTAIVVTEDLIACGIIKAIKECGGNVPEDLSVVGFDDSLPAQLITPALTTVHQDIQHKAEASVELLMKAIKRPKIKSKPIIQDVYIMQRDSVKAL